MKKKNRLYEFLEASGVLHGGTPEEIALAKRMYWNQQKRLWRQAKRRESKRFEVYLSGKALYIVKQKAKALNVSITRYITLSAISNKEIVSDQCIGQIRQCLILGYGHIEDLLSRQKVSEVTREMILTKQEEIENSVLQILKASRAQ